MWAATSQVNDTMSMLDVARAYKRRTWCVLPVPFRKKRPILENWPELRLTEEQLAFHFGGGPTNLGVLLGVPSSGLIDVDLDALEAVLLASGLLPPTESVFGRAGKPRSHFLYVCDPVPATEQLKDIDGTMIVELRSTGAQTVFPRSVHPTGEPIRWDIDGQPARIDGVLLLGYVRRLAAAALLARHWPAEGSRHFASLALAGGLLRGGWLDDDVEHFVVAVARAAGDDQAVERGANIRTTSRRLIDEARATGWPTLADIVGGEVVDRARHWLGMSNTSTIHGKAGASSAGTAGSQYQPWPAPKRVLGLPAAPSLDLSLLPSVISRVAADSSDRLQCPPDYVAWPLIASAAGLIGRRCGVRPRQRDDWTERACLWVVVIGPPSTLKSPALKEGVRPLRFVTALDNEAYRAEVAAWEAECEAIRAGAGRNEKPPLPAQPIEVRRLTTDATTEKLADLMATSPGLTMFRDELTGWVNSFNRYSKAEGDRQFFLECYSGGAHTVDRIVRGTVRVPDVYLSIIGGAQPDTARTIFGIGDDDGLAARFTAIYPEIPATFKDIDRWPDTEVRRALNVTATRLAHTPWGELLLSDDFDGAAMPFCRLDSEGSALWSQWHSRLMTRLRSGEWDGRHAGRIGKYPGVVARLALVFHLVEWASGQLADDQLLAVPAETVARALDLLDGYLKPMDERVYRAFDRTQAAHGGERIARWLLQTRPESFTLREVRRHEWSGLTEPGDVSAAIEWLAAMGWVREADPDHRPGRPSNRFAVNPRLWEARYDAA